MYLFICIYFISSVSHVSVSRVTCGSSLICDMCCLTIRFCLTCICLKRRSSERTVMSYMQSSHVTYVVIQVPYVRKSCQKVQSKSAEGPTRATRCKCVSVQLCVRLCKRVYVCMCMYGVCMCVCACVCVCMYVYVCGA